MAPILECCLCARHTRSSWAQQEQLDRHSRSSWLGTAEGWPRDAKLLMRQAEESVAHTPFLRQPCSAPWKMMGPACGMPSCMGSSSPSLGNSANNPKHMFDQYLSKMKIVVRWEMEVTEGEAESRATSAVWYGNVCLESSKARKKKTAQQAQGQSRVNRGQLAVHLPAAHVLVVSQ